MIGTTHADGIDRLVNRVVEQGLPAYLLREIDLVVFPRRSDGERYVGEVVELVAGSDADAFDCTTTRKDGTQLHWHEVCRRVGGRFEFAVDAEQARTGAGTDAGQTLALFERVAHRTDRPIDAVVREYERKKGYVDYLVREGISDPDDLFAFLADLQTNEAATVQRAASTKRSVADDD